MHRGIIHSGAAIHFKRHLNVLNQLVIDAEIEVVHIAAPVAGGRYDTVSPTGISVILLLVIQKVSVEFTHNVILVAEHEKSCRGGMLFPIRADTDSTQLQEEIFILQGLPHMAGAGEAHSLAITADAFFAEHRQVHFAQNEHVLRFHGCVPHHGLIFLLGAAIVALTVTAVCAERISVHIHRFIGAFRAGNIDDHDMIGIVDDVPELLDESVRVWQIYRVQGFIRPFFHAQQDNAAVGIGKSGIGFPNALGKPAKGFLGLNTVILPILLDFGKVNHGFPPLRAL